MVCLGLVFHSILHVSLSHPMQEEAGPECAVVEIRWDFVLVPVFFQ